MRSRFKLAAGVAFLVASLVSSVQADVYVICNPGLNLVDSDIKDIFMGEKQSAGSIKLTPFDNKNSEDEFTQKALGVSKAKYEAQWAKKAFRDGVSTPQAVGADVDVVVQVKSIPGGVGYVTTSPGSDVKVLRKY